MFLRGIGTLAWPWWLWIGLLTVVNAVAPLFFLGSLEAKVVLAAILVGAVIQLWIVSRRGFVRLLGLGHILVWVPMLLWLVPRLANLDAGTPFGRWLFAVVALDLASLAIDLVDVGRYLAGERQPAPGTEP
ncbi:MAG: hypothetical protein ACE5EG_11945, partial [Thermoanaerobaculia bacterium]